MYAGNLGTVDRWQHAREFVLKYGHLIGQEPPLGQTLPPITEQRIQSLFKRGKHSAAGPDGWTSLDLKFMSPMAAHFLPLMYAAVERGAPWPTQLLEAKAIFLGKGPLETGGPFDFSFAHGHVPHL